MANITKTVNNINHKKNIITYLIVFFVFITALWLSMQNENPSKFPKVITDEFTFTAWVNDGEDYLKKIIEGLQK